MAEAGDQATDEVADGIKRALDAAEAANEAAQDIASLQASYKAFAEAVIRGQRRNTLFAAGAAVGSLVALAMGGIVYFRSVEDLRVASAVQSEAAALLVEELTRIDRIGDVVEEQQDRLKVELLELLEKVKDEIRRAAMEGETDAPAEMGAKEAQVATTIREGVKADLEAVRDEVLAALAEMRVDGQGLDTAELMALMAELKSGMDGGGAVEGGAKAPAPEQAPEQAQDQATTPRPAKPAPKPAPEPDPFTYP